MRVVELPEYRPLPASHRERAILLAEMSERVSGIDHEAARWTGRTVGGFIQDGSTDLVRTLCGDCVACVCRAGAAPSDLTTEETFQVWQGSAIVDW